MPFPMHVVGGPHLHVQLCLPRSSVVSNSPAACSPWGRSHLQAHASRLRRNVALQLLPPVPVWDSATPGVTGGQPVALKHADPVSVGSEVVQQDPALLHSQQPRLCWCALEESQVQDWSDLVKLSLSLPAAKQPAHQGVSANGEEVWGLPTFGL